MSYIIIENNKVFCIDNTFGVHDMREKNRIWTIVKYKTLKHAKEALEQIKEIWPNAEIKEEKEWQKD